MTEYGPVNLSLKGSEQFVRRYDPILNDILIRYYLHFYRERSCPMYKSTKFNSKNVFQDRCRASYSAWAPGTRSVGWRKTLMDSLPGPSRHYQRGIFYEYSVLCKSSTSGFLSCDMTYDVTMYSIVS
jgi:hypothetical protein